MDGAYISAVAALAGTAIGGLASFATSWVTQQAQTRAQRRAAERDNRAALFGRFLDEAAKLYSDALQTSRDDVTGLIGIYALTNRIRLLSTPEVVEAADTVVRIIVDTYLATSTSIRCGISARRAGRSCRRSDGAARALARDPKRVGLARVVIYECSEASAFTCSFRIAR